jgi:hypothetical protein
MLVQLCVQKRDAAYRYNFYSSVLQKRDAYRCNFYSSVFQRRDAVYRCNLAPLYGPEKTT